MSVTDRGMMFAEPSVVAILAGRKTQTRRLCAVDGLRARLRGVVRSDFPMDHVTSASGVQAIQMNRYGAVSAKDVGAGLGLRPGEFDFLCPFVNGTTELRVNDDDGCWTIMPDAGQRLWVRERFQIQTGAAKELDVRVRYAAGESEERVVRLTPEQRATLKRHHEPFGSKWTSPLLMPRWATRLTLEVVEVRLERLQALSQQRDGGRAEVLAEGFGETLDPQRQPLYGPLGQPGTHRDPWAAYAEAWGALHKDDSWDTNPWVWVLSFRTVSRTQPTSTTTTPQTGATP